MNVASEDDVLLMATKAFMHGHKVATLMVMLELVSLMGHHGRSIVYIGTPLLTLGACIR